MAKSDSRKVEIFKGALWINYKGIIFTLGLAMSLFCLFVGGDMIYLAVMGSIYWAPLFPSFHYFVLSNTTLSIRHHIFFWKRSNFLIDEIAEIKLFQLNSNVFKHSNRLSIIFKDGSAKSYQAATLRDYHWAQLLDELQRNNVKVVNELSFIKSKSPNYRRFIQKFYRYISVYFFCTIVPLFFINIRATDTKNTIIKVLWLTIVIGGVFILKRSIVKAGRETKESK